MRLFLILIILSIIACNNQAKVESKEVKAFSETDYLEGMNSSGRIYEGTKMLSDIKASRPLINHQVIYRTDLFKSGRTDLDSIYSEQTTDSLFISTILFVSGKCLKYLPYYEKAGTTMLINMPEIVAASVELENGEPFIVEEGCSIENVIEVKLAIPKKELSGISDVYLNGTKQPERIEF